MESLLIRSRLDGSGLRWYRLAANGQMCQVASGEATSSRGKKGRPERIIWLVQAQDVTLLRKTIPAKRASDLNRAVPFAVEEDLAIQDIGQCAFAVSRVPVGDDVIVAVVDKEKLGAGLGCLQAHGVRPSSVLPDVLALKWEESEWSVQLDGDCALVRTAWGQGYAVGRNDVEWALQQSIISTPVPARPKRIKVYGGAIDFAGQDVELESMPNDSEQAFEKDSNRWPSFDLISELDVPGSLRAEERRYLKLAAGLLAGASLLIYGSAWLELQQLKEYEQHLDQAIKGTFRAAVPEASRVVNPRVQIDQKLQRIKSQQSGLSKMISGLAYISVGLAKEKDFTLKRVSYQGGVFYLNLRARSLQQLDSIASGIRQSQSYQATIESVDRRDGFVVSTLRVKGKS